MKAAAALCLSALLSGLLPAQEGGAAAELHIDFSGQEVQFRVAGPENPFLGAVLLSLDGSLTHYFQGLPPILSTFVVLGIGEAQDEYKVSVPQSALPPGVMLYAQGLAADGKNIWSTQVRDLVLDVTAPF